MPVAHAVDMDPYSYNNGRYVDDLAPSDERTYGTFTHLVGFLSLLDFTILGLIGCLIMWRIRGKESPFLDDHGREAVNFQISLLIYTIVGSAIVAIMTLGVLVLPWIALIFLLRLIGGIQAAIAANRGEYYRYPATIRFLNPPDQAQAA